MKKLRVIEWVGAATICIPISFMGSFLVGVIFIPLFQLIGIWGWIILLAGATLWFLMAAGYMMLKGANLVMVLVPLGFTLLVLDYALIFEAWPYSIRFPWLGGIGIFLIMMRYLIPAFMKEWIEAKKT